LKIAVISEDSQTISQHFGMAPLYVVVTVEDGKVANKETRPKAGHHNLGGHHEEHASGEGHGFGAAAQQTHATMAGNITDCQVLIGGGMGMGAYNSLKSFNIEPIITDIKNIDEAINLYLADKLENLMERLH